VSSDWSCGNRWSAKETVQNLQGVLIMIDGARRMTERAVMGKIVIDEIVK
jgi:hypothetical protein